MRGIILAEDYDLIILQDLILYNDPQYMNFIKDFYGRIPLEKRGLLVSFFS